MPIGHPRESGSSAFERAENVYLEDTFQPRSIDLLDAGLSFQNSGTVDQSNESLVVTIDDREKSLHVVFHADVCLDGKSFPPVVPDVANHLVGRCLSTVEVDANYDYFAHDALPTMWVVAAE